MKKRKANLIKVDLVLNYSIIKDLLEDDVGIKPGTFGPGDQRSIH
jgi:hypothetical protein